MDLSYGAGYEAYRAQVRDFLAASWPLSGDDAELDRPAQMVLFRERAIERGYLCRNIPKRYGGSEQEPDVLKAQILREEFARAQAPGEVRGIGPSMLVPTLLERGEEWQKEKTGHAHLSVELRLERRRVRAQVDHARRRLDRTPEPRHRKGAEEYPQLAPTALPIVLHGVLLDARSCFTHAGPPGRTFAHVADPGV